VNTRLATSLIKFHECDIDQVYRSENNLLYKNSTLGLTLILENDRSMFSGAQPLLFKGSGLSTHDSWSLSQ
jgi:hypothetical protein